MSTKKVRQIKKNIIERQRYEAFLMEHSIAGSALLTVAKLAGVKEGSCFTIFQEAQNMSFKNVKELVEYFATVFNIKKEYKRNIVLVYDENNVMAPAVTVCISSSEGNVMFLPVGESGYTPAVLRHINDENVTVEYIYKDEDED